MAMGTRDPEQPPLWIAASDLPVSPEHPFYTRLNALLDTNGFDTFVEERALPAVVPEALAGCRRCEEDIGATEVRRRREHHRR